MLCDASDGRPLAVMDSIEVTIRRTAAATAVAAKHLAEPGARTVTICGCGSQGRARAAGAHAGAADRACLRFRRGRFRGACLCGRALGGARHRYSTRRTPRRSARRERRLRHLYALARRVPAPRARPAGDVRRGRRRGQLGQAGAGSEADGVGRGGDRLAGAVRLDRRSPPRPGRGSDVACRRACRARGPRRGAQARTSLGGRDHDLRLDGYGAPGRGRGGRGLREGARRRRGPRCRARG